MKEIARILFAGLLVGICCFLVQDKVRWADVFADRMVARSAAAPAYRVLQLADTLLFFYRTNTVFIDVRPPASFEQGHIEGALNLPGGQITTNDPVFATLKHAERCVVYCGGIGCSSSGGAAAGLRRMGIEPIFVYDAGWEEWQACRLPTATTGGAR
jgi:rhodanese-related sulfurtransferase